jgi:YD repeat-containing protein
VPDSKNNKIITYYKYVDDYPVTTGTDDISKGLARQKLLNMNNLIEKTTWKKTGSDSTLLSADLSLYGLSSFDDLVYKESLQRLGPQPFTASGSNVNGFSYDNNYVSQTEFLAYDGMGNPTNYAEKNGIKTVIIWSKNRAYPIANVVNADTTQVFFTSFEDGGTGTAGNAVTGTRYYNAVSTGQYIIPANKRPAGSNLKMTYWYYDGQWKLKPEVPYSYIISEPGASRYDEVRVYPPNAQMKTYCYEPGFGISNITDANNRVTYYEYDPFGRLVVVKDQDGKIVKTYEYHLATDND